MDAENIHWGFLIETYLLLLCPFQFVGGFGKGGTSLPFWEDVYGFNMSCVGRELVQDAAKIPIVDVVDDRDLVTNAAVLKVSLSLHFPNFQDTCTINGTPIAFCSVNLYILCRYHT